MDTAKALGPNTDNWSTYILYIVTAYFVLDMFLIVYNIGYGVECDKWIKSIFLITNIVAPDSSCKSGSNDKSGLLSEYASYAGTKPKGQALDCLYDAQVRQVINDVKKDEIVHGYSSTELLIKIIVPTTVILATLWYGISTQASKAEWTFWILIGTVIYTGLSTLIFDTNIQLLGETNTASPLDYISKKLNFGPADELKYSFIARKQNGDECLIDGTMLGIGSHPKDQPPSYRGQKGICDNVNLPLY